MNSLFQVNHLHTIELGRHQMTSTMCQILDETGRFPATRDELELDVQYMIEEGEELYNELGHPKWDEAEALIDQWYPKEQ